MSKKTNSEELSAIAQDAGKAVENLGYQRLGSNLGNPKGIWFRTGMTLLDLASGAGEGLGQEAGDVIQLFAESQAGKTWYANGLIGASYHKYKEKFHWIYDDAERGNKFDTRALYGIDIIPQDEAEQVHSKTIQEVYARIITFAEGIPDGECGIYVLDSLDAVGSQESASMSDKFVTAFQKNKVMDDGSFYGEKNKFMSQIFLTNVLSTIQGKVLVVLVSQMRDVIGGAMYGPKRKPTGGSTVPFMAGNRSKLRKLNTITVNGRDIGAHISYEAAKSRGNMPWREVVISEYFSFGMDNVGSNIDYLYDLLTATEHELKKPYATGEKKLTWDGGEYTREELIAHIDQNRLFGELERRVIADWVSREKEAAKSLSQRVNPFMV